MPINDTAPPGDSGTPVPLPDYHQRKKRQTKLQPVIGYLRIDLLFAALAVALLALFNWPWRWLISGAPLLSYSLLLGAVQGHRVLPFLPLWTMIALINLSYSVAATSWLLYWAYTAACCPALALTCVFQFSTASRFIRKRMRSVLRGLQFANDTVAFFDLPALEIDVDVEGLMCVRGLSFSLSSLTLVAYGVEVGIKLSDDMEVALLVDQVTIKLFRRIDISDVYGNIKGGFYEMTFGKLAKRSKTMDGEPLMVTDTSLLAAAAASGDATRPGMPRMLTLNEHMTGGKAIESTSVKTGFDSVQQLSTDDDRAEKRFQELLKWITETSFITTSRKEVEEVLRGREEASSDTPNTAADIRAAICSQLHDKPSIPHPANKAIRVSSIQNLTPPHVRNFLHRLPLLLRFLLNPLSYFHPVYIDSITVGGSGKFMQHMLDEKVFPAHSDTGIKNLKQRISAWLSEANFVFQVANVVGQASVPIDTDYHIVSTLTFDDVMAYRTLPQEVDLAQIVRLGGADARIAVPSFLLPHHEHLLPAPPTEEDRDELQQRVDESVGKPKLVQAERNLDKRMKDEASMQVSAHGRLPSVFDQSLLDFIAALVKATKIIEMEKEDPVESTGFRQFAKGLGTDVKEGMRRLAVDAAANDRWIAKLVGKVTTKLETMQGEVGYSADVPIPLAPYRAKAESASKLMV
ncbi:hypothetical protein CAC42_5481 [Sphaceloma murrayae]|uniref:Uncharacterized protein n=1 Tax=Sphaceloma murrayae TaxID=2082308 RepID=A0A2K1QKA5_9PEZI|nr:hypothetical protein CAC42_5481 [Sphaceloma murrayae]